MPEIKELLTIKETAEVIQCSERQVKRMIASGDLPVWRPSRQIVRVPREELLKWASAGN